MNAEIASKLIKLRKSHGFSQGDMAERIGVSRQAVSKWECAESSPDTDNLIALSKLYNITIDELLDAGTESFGNGSLDRPADTTHPFYRPFARNRKEWVILMAVFSATFIIGLLILLGVIDLW